MSKWHLRYLVSSTDAPELNKRFLFNRHGNILSALPRSSCLTIKGGSCGLWRKYGLPPSHVGFSEGLGTVDPLKEMMRSSLITGWEAALRQRSWDLSLSVKMSGYFWFRSIWSRNLLHAESENSLEGDTHLKQRGGIKLYSPLPQIGTHKHKSYFSLLICALGAMFDLWSQAGRLASASVQASPPQLPKHWFSKCGPWTSSISVT